MNKEILNGFTEILTIQDKDLAKSSAIGADACKPQMDKMRRIIASIHSLHSQLDPELELNPEELGLIGKAQSVLYLYLVWYNEEKSIVTNLFRKAA